MGNILMRSAAGERLHVYFLLAIVFALLSTIYLFFYTGIWDTSDEGVILATAESLAKRGEFTANQLYYSDVSITLSAQQDEVVSSYEPLQPLLAAGLARIALLLPHFGILHTTVLLNIVVTAALAMVTALVVMELGYDTATVILSALIVGLCTIAFPYSKQSFREPLAGLLLMTAALSIVRMLHRKHFGEVVPLLIALILAYSAKESSLMALPVFTLVFVAAVRATSAAKFHTKALLVPALVVALVAVGFFVLLAGRTDLAGFSGRTLSAVISLPGRLLNLSSSGTALVGLLLSPGKGFVIFTPITLATIWSFPRFFRAHRREALLFGGVCISLWLGYAVLKSDIWWGGLGWGPRFLVPLAGFVVVPLAPLLSETLSGGNRQARTWLAAIICLSLYMQLLGAATDVLAYQAAVSGLGIPDRVVNSIWNPFYSPLIWLPQFFTPDNWNFGWARYWGRGGGIDWFMLGLILLSLCISLGALRYAHSHKMGTTVPSVLGAWLGASFAFVVLAGCIVFLMYDDPRLLGGDDRKQLLTAVAEQSRPQDVLMLYDHKLTQFVMNYNKSDIPWYSLWEEPMLSERPQRLTGGLISKYRRIWLLLDYPSVVRAPHALENFLAATVYPIQLQTFSDYARLALYATPSTAAAARTVHNTTLRFGDRIELAGFELNSAQPSSFRRGSYAELSLLWTASSPIPQNYTVFVQLLKDDGKVVWQADRQPVNGTVPSSTWLPGARIRDNYGFMVPADWQPGRYHLIVGMYLWPSLERLPVSNKSTALDNFAELDTIIIE